MSAAARVGVARRAGTPPAARHTPCALCWISCARAEGEGFEPSVGGCPYNGFRDQRAVARPPLYRVILGAAAPPVGQRSGQWSWPAPGSPRRRLYSQAHTTPSLPWSRIGDGDGVAPAACRPSARQDRFVGQGRRGWTAQGSAPGDTALASRRTTTTAATDVPARAVAPPDPKGRAKETFAGDARWSFLPGPSRRAREVTRLLRYFVQRRASLALVPPSTCATPVRRPASHMILRR